MVSERGHRESIGRVIDDKTKALIRDLLAFPDVTTEWQMPSTVTTSPVIPITFVKDGESLNYFSLVTTLGTPQTVAAQELRVECMFPADEQTEIKHLALMRTLNT